MATGVRLGVDYDFKGAERNLRKLLDKLQKENKMDVIIDTKKFDNITKEYEKLKKKIENQGIKVNTNYETQIKMAKSLEKIESEKRKAFENQEKAIARANTEREKALQYEQKIRMEIEKRQNVENIKIEKQAEIDARTLVGTFSELKKEQLEASDVARVISKQYGDLEIRGKSLNRVTGEYSVTLKNSAKENLVVKGAIDKTTGALRVQNEVVQQAKNVQLGFFEQMKVALERVPVWLAATTLYFQSFRFGRQLIEDISDINKSMIELEKVSSASASQLDKFKESSPKIAKDLGVLNTQVIDVTAEISKLGFALGDAEYLSKLALIGKTVGDLDSVGDSVDYLVATMKGFGLEVHDMEKVLSFLNHTANTTSIDFASLGEGIKRSSSAMSEANNSFEETIGLITAGFDISRNAEKTAQALVTTSMRIRGVSEDGEELGNLVPKLEGMFNKFGLSLKKDNNTFKSTFEILRDLSTVWDSDKMTDMDRAFVLEEVVGKRNSQIISGIIKNMQTAVEVAGSLEESQNSAILEHQKYMQGVEATYNNLQNSMTELNQKLLDSKTIIGTMNFAKWAVDNASALGKFNYGVVLATASLGIFTLAQRKALMATTDFQVVTQIGGLKNLTSNIALSTKALLGFNVATKGATVSATALNVATTGLFLGLPLLAQGIGAIISHTKRMREELIASAEGFQGIIAETDRVDILVGKKEELDAIESKSVEQKEELLNIEREIANLLPQTTSGYDSQNQALSQNLDVIKKLNGEKKDMALTDALIVQGNLEKKIENITTQLENAKKRRDELVDALVNGKDLFTWDSNTGESFKMSMSDMTSELETHKKTIDKLQPEYDAWKTSLDIINALTGKNTKEINDNTLTKEENTTATKNNWVANGQQQKNISDLTSSISNQTDQYDLLNQAQKEMQDSGYVSEETIKKLIENFSDFEDQTKLSKDGIISFVNTHKDGIKTQIQNEITKTDSVIQETQQRIKAYEAELKALEDLANGSYIASLNAKVASGELSDVEAESRLGIRRRIATDGMRYAQSQLNDLRKKRNFLLGTLDSLDYEKSSKSGSSSKSKEVSDLDARYKELNESLRDNQHLLDVEQEKLSQVNSDQDRISILNEINRLEGEHKRALEALNAEQLNEINSLQNVKSRTKEQEERLQEIISRYQQTTLEIYKTNTSMKNNIQTIEEMTKKQKEYANSLIDSYQKYLISNIEKEIDALEKSKQKAKETAQRKIDAIQDEIDALEKKNDTIKEQEEREERLLELEQLRERLANIRANKSVQTLKQQADGSWQYEYVADMDEVTNLEEQIKEKQLDLDRWERDLETRRLIDKKRARIEEIQDDLRRDEERYNRKIEKLQNFVASEKEKMDARDEELITSMEELKTALLGIDSSMYSDRLKALEEFVAEYNRIASKMNTVKTSSSSGGGGGGGSKSSGSSSGGSSSKTDKNGDGGISAEEAGGWDEFEKMIAEDMAKYHDGGRVGDQTTADRNLPNIVNKLFNTAPNEQIIKALKGELMIPEENIYKNFIPNIGNLVNSISVPKIVSQNKESESHYHIGRLEFPNVTKSEEVIKTIESLKSLSHYANNHIPVTTG